MSTQQTPQASSAKSARWPKRHLLVVALTGAVIGLFVACSSLRQTVIAPPDVPGAKFVGNEQCALCHEDAVKKFAFSVHSRLDVPGAAAGKSGCEACHGPGSKHVDAADGQRKQFIINPGKNPEMCMRCHLEKQAEFHMPFKHPVLEGKMSCNDCHDPHGNIMKPSGVSISRTNDTCAKCHKEQTSTHVFEHEALREGCVTCHAVHGSPNKKMLVENNNNLCLKCHAQIQTSNATVTIGLAGSNHATRVNHATCWASGCHDAVHGTNANAHLRY